MALTLALSGVLQNERASVKERELSQELGRIRDEVGKCVWWVWCVCVLCVCVREGVRLE